MNMTIDEAVLYLELNGFERVMLDDIVSDDNDPIIIDTLGDLCELL